MNKSYFFNDIFDLFFNEELHTGTSLILNPNIYIEDGVRKMDLKLPGYSKDDLEIMVNSNLLTIKTHDKFEETKRKSSFKKEFRLDNTVEIETIEAIMENGISNMIKRVSFQDWKCKNNIKIKTKRVIPPILRKSVCCSFFKLGRPLIS